MTETTLDDLFVLQALDPVVGARRFLCWDRALDRLTWLWRIDPRVSAAASERLARWATIDHPCVAAVHARGQTPSGDFSTTQYPGVETLETWRARATDSERARLFVAVVDGLTALATQGLAVVSPTTDVFVDARNHPLIAAVGLDRDGGPEDVLASVPALALALELSAPVVRSFEGARDLDALRRAAADLGRSLAAERAPWRRLVGGLGVAIALGAAVGGLWPRDEAPAQDPCREAAAAAADWRAQAPPVPEAAGTELRAWLDDWAEGTKASCHDAATAAASPDLVAARRRCAGEHLAALRGVWTAHATHACADPPCAGPTELLPPPDACAWGHAEAYLHRPWADRPVPHDTVARVGQLRAMAALGVDAGVQEALAKATELDEIAPRWRAWVDDTRARVATDDATWRRASWASVVDAVEAGDELGALDAMVSRAIGARARGLQLRPAPTDLARTLATRVVASYGPSARVQAWVDGRLARLNADAR